MNEAGAGEVLLAGLSLFLFSRNQKGFIEPNLWNLPIMRKSID
jgi:hypothetical protein